MGIPISSNLDVNAPKPLDSRYCKFVGGVSVPYDDVAEVNATIVSSRRHPGLTVLVDASPDPVEYWYVGGTADGDLVVKSQGSGSALPDGGTTGQVLGKISDSDGDVGWINQTGGNTGYESPYITVLVALRESNGGGQALISDLTTQERAIRPAIKELRTDTLQIVDMQIGVNTNRDHFGLNGNTLSGIHNGIAYAVERGDFADESIILMEASQGGSTIAEWDSGSYPTKFTQRVAAVKAYCKSIGKTPQFHAFYTHGINDDIANTDLAIFKAKTIARIKQERKEIGFAPYYITDLMTGFADIQGVLDEIVEELPFCYRLQTPFNTGLQDAYHWNQVGFIAIADNLANLMTEVVGEREAYVQSQISALSGDAVVVAPPDDGVYVDAAYTTLSSASDAGNGVINYNGAVGTTNGGPGGTATLDIDATGVFKIKYFKQSLPDAVVIGLDADPTADYSSTNVWRAYMYFVSGTLYVGTNGNENQGLVPITTSADLFKWVKSGNDLILQASTNSGATFSTIHTHTGALTGMTSLKLRVRFANTFGGAKLAIQNP